MKKYFLLIVLSLFMIQCKKQNSERNNETIAIVDALGREVLVPKKVEKIIGLNAGSMRFISYMESLPLVVGVEDREHIATRPYNLAFPEIKKIPIIGPQPGGDAELIVKANPDVIFMCVPSNLSPDALQKKTGIPVVAIENGEFGTENEKVFQTLKIMGKILQKEDRAKKLIAYIEENINDLQRRTKDIPDESKPSVYVGGLSFSGPHGIGSTRANFTPFVLTNSKNVVSQLGEKALTNKPIMIDVEELIKWDPDYIFIDSEGWKLSKPEIQEGKPLHKILSAIKNDKVYLFPRYVNNHINYEYALIDSWLIGKTVYPEKFKDVDIDIKSKEILEMFYVKKVNLKDFDLVFKQITLEDYK